MQKSYQKKKINSGKLFVYTCIVMLSLYVISEISLFFGRFYVDRMISTIWQRKARDKNDYQSNLLAARECVSNKNFNQASIYANRALELSKTAKESQIATELISYCIIEKNHMKQK